MTQPGGLEAAEVAAIVVGLEFGLEKRLARELRCRLHLADEAVRAGILPIPDAVAPLFVDVVGHAVDQVHVHGGKVVAQQPVMDAKHLGAEDLGPVRQRGELRVNRDQRLVVARVLRGFRGLELAALPTGRNERQLVLDGDPIGREAERLIVNDRIAPPVGEFFVDELAAFLGQGAVLVAIAVLLAARLQGRGWRPRRKHDLGPVAEGGGRLLKNLHVLGDVVVLGLDHALVAIAKTQDVQAQVWKQQLKDPGRIRHDGALVPGDRRAEAFEDLVSLCRDERDGGGQDRRRLHRTLDRPRAADTRSAHKQGSA